MSRNSVPQEGDAAQREQHFWTQQAAFTPDIEAAYQQEMERMRDSRIRKTGIAALLLYGSFAVSDRTMVPDVYQKAWAIRFLFVMPIMWVCMNLLHRLPSPRWREIALSSGLLITGMSLPVIAGISHHPNATHYQTGITLIILFGNIVLNLRFRSALVTSVILTVAYGASLFMIDGMTLEVRFTNWLFCLTTVAISMIANFRMDQDQRRAYLARRREEERNEELSHAVDLLAKLSAEDGLTQIANRREFDRRLEIEWGRARRDRLPLALILMDVDCFKNYNDHYGHPAGDLCLKKIVSVLKAIPQRSADLVARFGGEEFVVLLPGTSSEDAAKLAERMRQAIAELKMPHATSSVTPMVTASFGVAGTPDVAGDESHQLVAAADAALYMAKEKGRNQVVMHGRSE